MSQMGMAVPEGSFGHLATTATDPTGPFPIASLGFDRAEEIVWSGNANGHVSGYYGVGLQKYTAFQVVEPSSSSSSATPYGGKAETPDTGHWTPDTGWCPVSGVSALPPYGGSNSTTTSEGGDVSEITAVDSVGDALLAQSRRQLRLQYRSGVPKLTIVHEHLQQMRSLLVNDERVCIIGQAAGHNLVVLDLNTQQTLRSIGCADRGNCTHLRQSEHFLFCGESNGKIVVRNKQSFDVVHKFDAHPGQLADLAVNGPCLVSCGGAARNGQTHHHSGNERYLMVFDMRMMRSRPPLNMPFEPAFVSFIPTYSDRRLLVASKLGEFQAFEIGEFGVSYHVPTNGCALSCMRVSATKQCVAFGDAAGNIHLFADRPTPAFNFESNETAFADTALPVAPMSFDDPLASLAAVQAPFPCAAEQFTDYLSDWPTALCKQVYREPKRIPDAVLESMRIVQFVGYAPASKTQMRLNQCPYDLSLTATVAPTAAAGAAVIPGQKPLAPGQQPVTVGIGVGASPVKPQMRSPAGRASDADSRVPKIYRRVQLRARFSGDELRYEQYNRTPHSGIEAHNANGYVNSLLILLYHLLPVRALVGRHLCRRPDCLACELAFLFQMLDDAAGQQPCLANNFQRVLRCMQQADALGLLLNDVDSEAAQSQTRRPTDYCALVQSFARFLLQQLFKDLNEQPAGRTAIDKPADADGDKTTTTGDAENRPTTDEGDAAVADPKAPDVLLDWLFASACEQHSTCVKCSTHSTRHADSHMLSLTYPKISGDQVHTFESVLATSLCADSDNTSTYCDTCGSYEQARKRRRVRSLPPVLVLDTHVKRDHDIIFWKHHYAHVEHEQKSDGDTHCYRAASTVSDDLSLSSDSAGYKGSSERLAGYNGRRFNQPCRYGTDCARPDCRFLHEHRDDQFAADETKNHWLPVRFYAKLEDGGMCDVSREPSEGAQAYDLQALIYSIKDRREPHLVTITRVMPFGEAAAGDDKSTEATAASTLSSNVWLLFNDIVVNRVNLNQVLHFDTQWKWPCLLYYVRADADQLDRMTVSLPKTPSACRMLDESVFALDECLSLRRRLSSSPFVPLAADELPADGDLVAIDAEFVALNQDDAADNDNQNTGAMMVARVTCLRGSGEAKGTPFMDDYITSSMKEPVLDYLTKFSGIQPGDLSPQQSTKHLTTLKSVYLKLRYLIGRHVVFVGHGLRSDFRMLNLIVPKPQVRDTVDLFHLPRQRMVSLRFLAWHFLGEVIQQDTHDSVEDALVALRLYEKYLELSDSGELPAKLEEMYEQGKSVGWKVPDNTTTAAAADSS